MIRMKKQTNCKSIQLAIVSLMVSNEGLKLNFCTNWIALVSDPQSCGDEGVKVYWLKRI